MQVIDALALATMCALLWHMYQTRQLEIAQWHAALDEHFKDLKQAGLLGQGRSDETEDRAA